MTARTLARAGIIVSAAYLASRILGWLRVVVIGNLPLPTEELDAYFAAFRVPDLIYQLAAAGAISSALIPVLAGLIHADDDRRAWRVVSTVLNAMLVALAVICALMWLFAPELVPLIVPGFDPGTATTTVHLTRLMLLSPILLAVGAVLSAVLNAEGRFAAAAAAPVFYNLAIIGAALALSPLLGVDSLALGVVVGSALHVFVQVVAARRRFRYRPRIELADPAARQTFLLLGPRALGLGASQITFIVNTSLATLLGVGAVLAYNVAFSILQIPLGIIGFPLGIVLLPAMSRALAAGSIADFARLVVQALRLVLFVMLFVTVVGLVLRRHVVYLLFDHGFDDRALAQTADALAVFLLGTAAHSMNVILTRAFYSAQDTRTPVAVAILSVAVNVAVSVATVSTLGLMGLALGIALGGWVEASMLALLLWRRTPAVGFRRVAEGLVVFGLGALLAGAAALAVVRLTDASLGGVDPGAGALLLQTGLATAAAGAVYLLYARLVRAPELPQTSGLIRSALRRG